MTPKTRCGGGFGGSHSFYLTSESKEQIAPELAEDLIDLVHAYL